MMRDYPIKRFIKDQIISEMDIIAEETQFTLFVNKKELVTFLCSPSDQKNLSLGYLISEGLIHKISDVNSIDFQEMENYVDISLDSTILLPESFENKKVLTSGCGKGSIFLSFLQTVNLLSSTKEVTIQTRDIYRLMREFQMKSELFLQTGGVHSVAICSSSEILFYKEDIGRHNAVDKILGECLIRNVDTNDKMLLLSGRMAVEIVQKAGRAGIQILLSKSAPTSLAIDIANKIGMTLVGFIRGERMNVYTHSRRIIAS